jgi:RimJ/RimL family protein N-acetyltransferase
MDSQPIVSSAGEHPIPPAVHALEGTLTLRDAVSVYVRAIRPDDTERLRQFHAHLSADTIIFRFFRMMPELSRRDAEHFTHVDYRDRMALIATESDADDAPILSVVRYDKVAEGRAEVAFVVADAWQGKGISTALLLMLIPYAQAQGFEELVAITMGTNIRMLEVLRHCGYPSRTRYSGGDTEVYLDITAQPEPLSSPIKFAPKYPHVS